MSRNWRFVTSFDHRLESAATRVRKKSSMLDATFVFFAHFGPALFFLELFLLIVFALSRHQGIKHTLLSVLVAMMAAVTTKLIVDPIAYKIGRNRPFVTYHYKPLLSKNAQDPSFPSNHAGGALALATVLVAQFPQVEVITILLALLVILSRLYTGLHYLSDVMAGGLVGFLVAMVYLWVMR